LPRTRNEQGFFVDKKDPSGFFRVKNICEKEITEKEMNPNYRRQYD
jgi:hypothetical protein